MIELVYADFIINAIGIGGIIGMGVMMWMSINNLGNPLGLFKRGVKA